MATLQFPANPNDGDSFTSQENGVTYTFDATGGGGWTANNPAGIDDEYVNIDGDTMTGDLALPNLEASGNISADGDIQSTSQNGGQLAGFRNLIQNGDFRIWQRGTTFGFVSNPRFTADRWRTGAERGVDRVAFYNKYGAKCTVAPAGSPLIGQPIEIDVPGRPGPFVEGQQYTFSCVVKNAAAADVSLNIQHRITSDDNTGAQEIVPTTVIGSDVLNAETLSFTFTYTSAMRPSENKTCTYVEISADNRTSEMTITNIQLEPGPVATPFENRPTGLELQLCARYFQTLPLQLKTIRASSAPSSLFADGGIPLIVPMRVTPTLAFTRMDPESTLTLSPIPILSYTNSNSITAGYSGAASAGGILGFSGTADAEL
jgi:hypothetical protein